MTMPSDQEKPFRYAAYLARLWQDHQAGRWRASAQSVRTGEKTLFASLSELVVFLETETFAHPNQDVEIL